MVVYSFIFGHSVQFTKNNALTRDVDAIVYIVRPVFVYRTSVVIKRTAKCYQVYQAPDACTDPVSVSYLQ